MKTPTTPAPMIDDTMNGNKGAKSMTPDKASSIEYKGLDEPRVSSYVWDIIVVLGLFLALVILVYKFAPSSSS
jgi:hypothetical protein